MEVNMLKYTINLNCISDVVIQILSQVFHFKVVEIQAGLKMFGFVSQTQWL
jgi:hypothetical protein